MLISARTAEIKNKEISACDLQQNCNARFTPRPNIPHLEVQEEKDRSCGSTIASITTRLVSGEDVGKFSIKAKSFLVLLVVIVISQL
jgi:hypothetical protein